MKFMRTALVAAIIAVSTTPLFADETPLLIDGIPLEDMCLSQHWNDREKCIERVDALRDDERHERISGCYLGELLTLKTTAVQGYQETLELMEWLETPEGAARTSPYRDGFVKWAKEHAAGIEPAADTIKDVRENGGTPRMLVCRAVRWLGLSG